MLTLLYVGDKMTKLFRWIQSWFCFHTWQGHDVYTNFNTISGVEEKVLIEHCQKCGKKKHTLITT